MSQNSKDPSKWSWLIWVREHIYPVIIGFILTVIAGLVTASIFLMPPAVVNPDGSGVAKNDTGKDQVFSPAMGYIPDPEEAEAYAKTLEFPDFSDTPAWRAIRGGAIDPPDDVFLWDAVKSVLGHHLPPRNQNPVGSCVGFGWAKAIDYLTCVQIANGITPRGTFKPIAPEPIYWGSRVECNGGTCPIPRTRLDPHGDGSSGHDAARWVTEWGGLPRGQYEGIDLTRYDWRQCRKYQWTGCPDVLEPIAKQYPVKTVTRVRTWGQLKAAIQNGYPVAVCSIQGFAEDRWRGGLTRDSEGFAKASGKWGHCMCFCAIRGGNRPGAYADNSWGPDFHRGPRGAGDGPTTGFWVDARVVDEMLSEGDSYALSGFKGFPSQKIDWLIRKPVLRDALTARAGGRLIDSQYYLVP